MFKQSAPLFQEAINKSGYEFQLKFDPKATEKKHKNRNRKHDVLWFNPPYNSTVSTNIGKEFLKLIAVAPKTRKKIAHFKISV